MAVEAHLLRPSPVASLNPAAAEHTSFPRDWGLRASQSLSPSREKEVWDVICRPPTVGSQPVPAGRPGVCGVRVWPAPAVVSPEMTQATVLGRGFWAGGFGSVNAAKGLTEPSWEPGWWPSRRSSLLSRMSGFPKAGRATRPRLGRAGKKRKSWEHPERDGNRGPLDRWEESRQEGVTRAGLGFCGSGTALGVTKDSGP